MLKYLGATLREERRRHKIKLVRIGAALDKSEAALSRFEGGKSWPNDLDAAVAAYAAEMEMDPLTLWTEAIERWRGENEALEGAGGAAKPQLFAKSEKSPFSHNSDPTPRQE